MTSAQAAKKEFLDARRIGGSTAAQILGVSDWGTPADAYDEIVAAIEGRSVVSEDNGDQERGHRNEPMIAADYVRVTGRKLARVSEQVAHAEHPFLTANIDRRIVGTTAERGEWGVLEIKCPRLVKFRRIQMAGKLPADWVCQLMHNLFVTVRSWGAYAIESAETPGSPRMLHFDVDMNLAWCHDVLVPATTKFWQEHIEPRVRPDDTIVPAAELPEVEFDTELVTLHDEEWEQAVETYRQNLVIGAMAQAQVDDAQGAMREIADPYSVVEGAGVRVYYRPQAGAMTWDAKKIEAFIRQHGAEPERFKRRNKASRPFRVYDLASGKALSAWAKAEAERIAG